MTGPNLTRRPCRECGRQCRTASGVCAPCRGIGVDANALTGGRWVVVRGIKRWQPDPPTLHLVRTGGRPWRPKPSCGTERGYQRHRHLYRVDQLGQWPLPDDDPCGCKAAHAAHEALRRALARAESKAA